MVCTLYRKKFNSFLKKFLTQTGEEFFYEYIMKKSTSSQKERMDFQNAKLYPIVIDNISLSR